MWMTLAAAAFFAIILLVTLLRADRSVANGALTVITLLAIGVAVAATIRGFGTDSDVASHAPASAETTISVAMPALACLDELAGETVLTACEKPLFASPEAVAAAVSYVATQVTRLTALGNVATTQAALTPEIDRLRRAIERDRYGLVAYVLSARNHCQPTECAAYQSLTDHSRISTNMDERAFEAAILRYSPSWNAPPTAAPPALSVLAPTMPSGKPTNADFPTSASIPPVTIMTPEPPLAAAAAPPAPAKPAAAANAQVPSPRPAATAAKKPPPKPRPAAPMPAPVELAPAAPSADN